MKYLFAGSSLCLIMLAGCASYDGPRSSHVRYPDNDLPASRSDSRVPENARIIASNRVETYEDEEETSQGSHRYRDSEDADAAPTRKAPPSTYNRPRAANAAPATNRAVSGALGSLVSQAQAAYKAGNYQTAISTAERGLRIDRRAPALYLVMAQSYLALNQPTQAAQFANQGLRFSQSGSAEARALEKVRNGAEN
jgi:tetratricopeptide (TPR) repeat protein